MNDDQKIAISLLILVLILIMFSLLYENKINNKVLVEFKKNKEVVCFFGSNNKEGELVSSKDWILYSEESLFLNKETKKVHKVENCNIVK